jgi:arginyl-tRNA synthetase
MVNKLKDIIFNIILNVIKENNIKSIITGKDIKLEKIQNSEFGDYSSNILMIIKVEEGIRNDFINELKNNEYIKQNIKGIEYRDPGFLNFYLNENVLIDNLKDVVGFNEKMFFSNNAESFLIEHTSPNTNKPLHIGHLRNNVLAMAVIRILKALNNKVTVDCLFNDRGIHICKAMFGYLKFNCLEKPIENVLDE